MNTERRFAIIAGAALYAAARPVFAQPVAKVWRIGVLLHNIPFERLRLRELLPQIGLEEGLNLQFEVRTSQGQADRLDALAAELVAAKVDLIVAPNSPEIKAAKQAAQAITIRPSSPASARARARTHGCCC